MSEYDVVRYDPATCSTSELQEMLREGVFGKFNARDLGDAKFGFIVFHGSGAISFKFPYYGTAKGAMAAGKRYATHDGNYDAQRVAAYNGITLQIVLDTGPAE